ncbi:MAG: hypothetical protein ACR2OE_05680 [Thermomicrobiales bacterium]
MTATIRSGTMHRQWVLAERPVAAITARTFAMREEPVPEPGEGEALVRVVWLGIDPTQRTWLNEGATYLNPVAEGEVMRGSGVGQVIASKNARLTIGDWVYGRTGWQEYVLTDDERGCLDSIRSLRGSIRRRC